MLGRVRGYMGMLKNLAKEILLGGQMVDEGSPSEDGVFRGCCGRLEYFVASTGFLEIEDGRRMGNEELDMPDDRGNQC